MRCTLLLSILFLFTACSGGEEESSNWDDQETLHTAIEVWARASRPPHENSAAYLTISNTVGLDFELTGASTPRAGITELHSMEMVDGTMKMRRVESFLIADGTTLELKPGGNHLMFFELDAPWEVGQIISISLTLAGGLTMTVDAEVKAK